MLLSGRTRPLKSHYFLCESLYPKGNPLLENPVFEKELDMKAA